MQVKPMSFFTNCDSWGAAEWFERLANAIREQDKAVVAGDMMRMETYQNIAASSAMRLVRDYGDQVRASLSDPRLGAGEASGVTVSSTSLLPVIQWLEAGCDARVAADELRRLSALSASPAATRGEPVAWIQRSVLAELGKHRSATATVASGLLKQPFGDPVALYSTPPPARSEPAAEMQLDRALMRSMAMRTSTGDGYPVTVFFVDLAGAQDFHDFLANRCLALRALTPEAPGAQEETP